MKGGERGLQKAQAREEVSREGIRGNRKWNAMPEAITSEVIFDGGRKRTQETIIEKQKKDEISREGECSANPG